MKNIIQLVSLAILFASCASKTPETIVGIQLGVNPNPQIEYARNAGLLLSDGGDIYLPLSNDIKGYTEFWDMYDDKGKKILHTVWVRFAGKRNGRHNPIISPEDKDFLVRLYENKYGVCRPWEQGDDIEGDKIKSGPNNSNKFYHYKWRKGHLVIELSFYDEKDYPGLYSGIATYGYNYAYMERLEKKVEDKKNEGI